jgi:energy-coupling factor transport system ATP-binding protein
MNARDSIDLGILADNRLREWVGVLNIAPIVRMLDVGPSDDWGPRLEFDPISPDFDLAVPIIRPRELQLSSIRFSYPRGPLVLRDVSTVLEPGAVYVLEGRNGAGKSTLAKLLCGVIRPREGRILVDRKEYEPWKAPGHLVAYHFQNPDLQLFSTTVEDEVLAGPRALGVSQEYGASIARAFGLSHVGMEHPLSLPFVIRKRIALAATLATARPWMFLDEPTLAQDDASSETIAEIISRLVAAGFGIVLITHSSWLRQHFSSRTLRLEDGSLRRTCVVEAEL